MFWLALGYPLLAHLAVVFESPTLQWLALVWLLMFSLLEPIRQKRVWAWLIAVTGAIALYWLVVAGRGMAALYVPPVVIPFAMLMLFGSSLRTGSTPLVTLIAHAMRGEALPAQLAGYTRGVTIMWCCVFVAMIASAIGFAVWAPAEAWSLMTNVVHYFVLGAVFVLEFLYRRMRYGDLESWSLVEYLRRLMRVNMRNLK